MDCPGKWVNVITIYFMHSIDLSMQEQIDAMVFVQVLLPCSYMGQ
jgi:hypothetical protein